MVTSPYPWTRQRGTLTCPNSLSKQSYIHWIKQYIVFNSKRHPSDLAAADVSAFLSYLAVSRNVAALAQLDSIS
ncbi:MAG: phage integrase N-terminal SAM-like domain-containing protein [Pyrinomonadaceae bacterium]